MLTCLCICVQAEVAALLCFISTSSTFENFKNKTTLMKINGLYFIFFLAVVLLELKTACANDKVCPLWNPVERWSSHVIQDCDHGVPGTNKTNDSRSVCGAISACHSLRRVEIKF